MSSVTEETLSDVVTPCLVLDIEKVKQNATRMIDRCQHMGVKLRPHMKTHKCIEVADIVTSGRKRGIVVSTLTEAEQFTNAGYDDILFAAVFTQDKVPRMVKLASRLSCFTVMVDSTYGVTLLQNNPLPDDNTWCVLLKVDCGGNRCGVTWNEEEGVNLATSIHESGVMRLEGLYAHEGNAYYAQDNEEVKQIAATTTERINHLANRLAEKGMEVNCISIGSTPTCSQPHDTMNQLTEVHPGNYAFYDLQQHLLGSCEVSNIAMRVATRVKGHFPGRNQLLVDAGFTALSHDGKNGLPGGGYSSVDGHPHLRVTNLSQEVGYVENVDGPIDFDKFPLGSLLFLLPYHACATATRHQFYFAHSGDKIVNRWQIFNGW